jgi:hypothetical protein
MFARADLIDMYSLADPDRCKQYIVVAASALDAVFSQINLSPKDKGGIIYFQSIQGLLKGQSAEDLAMHNRNCVRLAFFFIRIFQTFGALTLTVLDSTLPTIDPSEYQQAARRPTAKYQPLLAKPLAGFPAAPPRRNWWAQGGALSSDPRSSRVSFYIGAASGAEDYRLLNKYLVTPADGNGSDTPMFFDRSSLYIPQDSLYDGVPAARVLKPAPAPVVVYPYKDRAGKRQASARLTITVEGQAYTVILSDIKLNKEAAVKPTVEIKLESEAQGLNPTDQQGRELPAAITAAFEEAVKAKIGFSVVEFLKERRYIDSDQPGVQIKGTRITIDNPLGSDPKDPLPISYKDVVKIEGKNRNATIRAKLDIGESMVGGKKQYVAQITFDGVKQPSDEIASMIDFDVTKQRTFVVQVAGQEPSSTKGQRIPAFLEERFVQMLKPLKEGKVLGGIRYTRAGLPKPYVSDKIAGPFRVEALWAALASDPPVKPHCVARAMQLLNVAAIRGEMRDGAYSSVCKTRFAPIQTKSLPTPGGPITGEYGIAALASLFVDSLQQNMPVTNTGALAASLQKIRAAFDSAGGNTFEEIMDSKAEACVGTPGSISVSGSVQARLQTAARTLMNRQATHLRNTMYLIFQLFNEQRIRSGIFEIHPNILAGGMEEVNRIAVAAREMLVDYYSDCEANYRLGTDALAGYVPASQAPVMEAEAEAPAAAAEQPNEDPSENNNNA